MAEAGTRWSVQKLDMSPAVVWAAGWRVRKARFLGWLVSSGQCWELDVVCRIGLAVKQAWDSCWGTQPEGL